MKRFYGFLYERDDFRSLALLPRVRLTTGSHVGIGFQWLTAWFHVWLWETGRAGQMIDLLPHLWVHWHRRWGCGVHLWWLHWRLHRWIYRPPETVGGCNNG